MKTFNEFLTESISVGDDVRVIKNQGTFTRMTSPIIQKGEEFVVSKIDGVDVHVMLRHDDGKLERIGITIPIKDLVKI